MRQPQAFSSTIKRSRRVGPRLSALDAEREASMADEGGVSAALLEIEDPTERRALHPGVSKPRLSKAWLVAGILGVIVVAAGFGWWRIRATM
jgi:cytochrome c-type biogenesis protein CcmH/NrfG